jgi:protein phosphatase 1 regulatory subunit 7
VCLQSNRLTRIENLDSLLLLDQLYLSENGLTKLEGLEKNVEISTLDLANNKIRVIENIEHLSKLEEFWVRRCFVLMFDSTTACPVRIGTRTSS